MNLDELQSVQSRERQASDMQDLRPSFYDDAAEFVRGLREERQRVVREDGLDAPEFARLTDDIESAERAIESIYERRVGKVVRMASIEAAEMPTGAEGLTDEERDLFESLVADISANRERVLSTISATAETETTAPGGDPASGGESGPPTGAGADPADGMAGEAAVEPTAEATPPTDRPRDAEGPDASQWPVGDQAPEAGAVQGPESESVSGGTSGEESDGTHVPESGGPSLPESGGPSLPESGHPSASDPAGGGTPEPQPSPTSTEGPADRSSADASGGENPTVDRATVRITRDVGEILCVDERAYHLASEDVVTLPEANAEPLVERGAAERIE